MGVHGLWRLIEPSGKPVPLETLENKVLAVDVSIWLHQAVKGFQDARGAPVANAHLLGIYHRICKLLYFKVKPVFIFDGGVPALKRNTIAKRNQAKVKNQSEADQLHKNLLTTILKHSALNKVLSEKTKAVISDISPPKKSKRDDTDSLFYLPPPTDTTLSSSSSGDEQNEDDSIPIPKWDLHSIDTKSAEFKALPIEVRHEILTDLKETRKQSSWGRINELPTESNDFSSFQMKRLLNRQSVQQALEETKKEMGGHCLSLGELENVLKDEGVISSKEIGSRIASNEDTRFLLIKDVQQALAEAKKKEENKLTEIIEENEDEEEEQEKNNVKNKADLEFDEDLEKAIALSLQDCPSTSSASISSASTSTGSRNKVENSFLENFKDGDFESCSSEEDFDPKIKFDSASSYMLEYSGLTPNEIAKILGKNVTEKNEKRKIGLNRGIATAENFVKTSQKKGPASKLKSKKLSQLVKNDEKMPESKDNEEIVSTSEENPNKERRDIGSPITGEISHENVVRDSEKSSDVINNRIVSSSSEEIVPQSKSSIEDQDAAVVELMSDSDDSEDLMEVPESQNPKIPSLEVVVIPDEELEDDLFKDIFEKSDETSKTDNDIQQNEVQETNLANSDKLESKNKDSVRNEENRTQIPCDLQKIAKTGEDSIRNDKETANFTEDGEDSKSTTSVPVVEVIENQELEKFGKTTETRIPKLSVEEIKEMKKDLEKEERELMAERSTKERLASNITDQMYQEAQELLELFGVPYIIAPMEAEAQCAFLDEINLTDGTITDDSDIWLFGGRTVYKNFFNHQKHVLEFRAEDIKHHFKLSREQMILLALLVGSDYTTGLSGVGPVTALEILAAFPPKTTEIQLTHNQLLSGLSEFRSWFSGKKAVGPKRLTLRNKLRNVSFNETFPNPQVVEAYLQPLVDSSREKFTWSKPNIYGLIEFARIKFGWTKLKSEEILKPVLKRLEDKRTQTVIRDYFKSVQNVKADLEEGKMSDRVKKAVKRIGGEDDGEEEEEPKKKMKTNKNDHKSRKTIKKQNVKKKGARTNQKKKKQETGLSDLLEDTLENEALLKLSEQLEEQEKVEPNIDLIEGEVDGAEEEERKKKMKTNQEDHKSRKTIKKQNDKKKGARTNQKKKKQEAGPSCLLEDTLENEALLKLNEPLEEQEKVGLDPEMEILKDTKRRSKRRLEYIEEEAKKKIAIAKTKLPERLHRKEPILQKQKETADMLRNKMKAIEVFRKGKKGPGYVKKRPNTKIMPKEDAGLSESSDE